MFKNYQDKFYKNKEFVIQIMQIKYKVQVDEIPDYDREDFVYERKMHYQKIAELTGTDPSLIIKKFPTLADDDGFDN